MAAKSEKLLIISSSINNQFFTPASVLMLLRLSPTTTFADVEETSSEFLFYGFRNIFQRKFGRKFKNVSHYLFLA
jgi:hypothetical protein